MPSTTAEEEGLQNTIAIISSYTELFVKCFVRKSSTLPLFSGGRKVRHRTVKLLGHHHLQANGKTRYKKNKNKIILKKKPSSSKDLYLKTRLNTYME